MVSFNLRLHDTMNNVILSISISYCEQETDGNIQLTIMIMICKYKCFHYKSLAADKNCVGI